MPDYATDADVQLAAGGVERLLQIADHDNDAEIDPGLVDDALAEAEALINSYVRKVRETPVTPVPEILKRMAANIAVYVLKMRRCMLTEGDAMLQDQRVAWLEGLASGKIVLGVNPSPAPSALNCANASERPTSKAVSRENLKGFS